MNESKHISALMFTDIVGSVALQHKLGTEAYTHFVTRHDEVIEQCLQLTSNHRILNETGDGFLVSFDDPADAVNTALRLQHRFRDHSLHDERVQVRIGLHLGVVTEMEEKIRGERRAVGMAINLAARIMDLAEPGQILTTKAIYDDARQYVRDHPTVPEAASPPPDEIEWQTHGYYLFKGNDEPQPVVEVGAKGLAPFQAPADSNKAKVCLADGKAVAGSAAQPAPMLPAEVSPIPEEVKESDVFLSYASIDDQPLASGAPGWISKFKRNLETRMEQLSGNTVKIWRPIKSQGNEDVGEAVLENLPQAKTLVSVISPPFANSQGCLREVRRFYEGTVDRPKLNDRSRLIRVTKTPVDEREMDDTFGLAFRDMSGFDFFERDTETGRIREFEESFGEEARQRYYERVYDLAFDICEVIKHYRPATGIGASPELPEPPADTPAKTIFLAAVTSDLQNAYDNLKRELLEQGHRVVPDAPLPIQIEALEEAVKGLLAGADLVVQLVGQNYGMVPENSRSSLAELQNQWAAKHASSNDTGRLIWLSRDLDVSDDRQLEFIRHIRENDAAEPTTEVIVTSLSGFKDVVVQNLAPSPPGAPDARPEDDDRPPNVYLICDQDDEEAIEALEDFLFDAGLEVSLPEFSAGPEQVGLLHREAICACDAVLVYYGTPPRAWVDIKLRDLLKANGYGRQHPFAAQAVYVAPPDDRRKTRFKSHTATVIRQIGDDFSPSDELNQFVAQLTAKTLKPGEGI